VPTPELSYALVTLLIFLIGVPTLVLQTVDTQIRARTLPDADAVQNRRQLWENDCQPLNLLRIDFNPLDCRRRVRFHRADA
jgi:hypothetical protein